jgi:putative PIN family toxin of toxin-antitoxin system
MFLKAASVSSTTEKKRIVLDTNVCLDLFVFKDPRWDALLSAMQAGQIDTITREDCRTEWLRVLDYPHLPVTPENKPAIIAEFDRYMRCLQIEAVNSFGLPICTDRDDQKFLELSLQADVAYLITKDKALLKCAKKTAKQGMFTIIAPQSWKNDMI